MERLSNSQIGDTKMYETPQTAPLSVQIMHRILREMQSGAYRYMTRLPSEVEIAESLGVSRTAVRDGLSILEREGFVTRKHGLGTIVNRHVLSVTTRIDLETEFLEMVRDAGFTPTVPYLEVRECTADADLARAMELDEGDEVIRIDRLVCADGIPTIFCEDYLAKKLVVDRSYREEDLHCPVFDFMKKFCGTDVYMDLTEMRAVNADKALAERLQIPEHTAVLHLNERGYTLSGKLVLYSREFYRENILHHTVLRIKI